MVGSNSTGCLFNLKRALVEAATAWSVLSCLLAAVVSLALKLRKRLNSANRLIPVAYYILSPSLYKLKLAFETGAVAVLLVAVFGRLLLATRPLFLLPFSRCPSRMGWLECRGDLWLSVFGIGAFEWLIIGFAVERWGYTTATLKRSANWDAGLEPKWAYLGPGIFAFCLLNPAVFVRVPLQ